MMGVTFGITRGFFTSVFAVLALLVVSAAWGDSPCGESVTVARGDTLDKIAKRCNTTVPALLEANSNIENPNLITVGMELRMPTSEQPQPRKPEPGATPYEISIEPDNGPPGAAVRLTASGFPPDTEVLIGTGQRRSEYQIIGRERSNANGALSAWVQAPKHANFGEEWVFVVALEGQGIEINSEPFTVRRPEGAPE